MENLNNWAPSWTKWVLGRSASNTGAFSGVQRESRHGVEWALVLYNTRDDRYHFNPTSIQSIRYIHGGFGHTVGYRGGFDKRAAPLVAKLKNTLSSKYIAIRFSYRESSRACPSAPPKLAHSPAHFSQLLSVRSAVCIETIQSQQAQTRWQRLLALQSSRDRRTSKDD